MLDQNLFIYDSQVKKAIPVSHKHTSEQRHLSLSTHRPFIFYFLTQIKGMNEGELFPVITNEAHKAARFNTKSAPQQTLLNRSTRADSDNWNN